MAVELVPEMAQNVFRPLLQRLEKPRPEADFLLDEIRDLIAGCGIGAVVLDHLLKIFHGILRHGVEKRKLHVLHKEFLNLVELANNQLYPKIRRLAAGEQFSQEERGTNLATLDGYIQRAQGIQVELTALNTLLDKPYPIVDFAKLAARKDAKDYEGYVDSHDIEARLKAAGDF